MQIKFGTDGWRGVIAKDFTFENISRVAQATMDYMNREGLGNKGLVIGYDRRFLSRDFARRVAEVAAGNDIHVRLTEDYAPTPAVSWAVREFGAGAGIMITASHNPPEYNGFKVKEAFGGSALPVTTRILEEIVAYNQENNRRVISVPYDEAIKKGAIELFDPCEGYFHQISRYVDLDLIAKAGIRAVVDPMYGAGCGFIPRLLAGVDEIHNSENPSFGGLPPEPIGQNLQELSALLKSGKYRVGLALDGDADRIGAVDENGDFFSSHCIFTVILRHLIEFKKMTGAVVKTVSTTRMVDLLAEKFGLELFETPIGFKHICELMLERDILIGGEESGGIGVKGHIPERDGILLGLLLLEAVAVSGKGLRQLLDETMDDIGHFYYQRIDRRIENVAKEQLIEKLLRHTPAEIDGKRVMTTNFSDGFKFIFENGDWLLIRPSGTEPVLRLYSEAGSLDQVERFLRQAVMIAGC
ncbi:MAG: phosphoglucomutase/phosphomannomutase family protein [Geobacteraceae bacterium]|nr:phosphoglucomutase/phosphomannomutase family protein [Geobacteraceae bacterium]NTW78978.1 phosphoglucomutase/phosphomannomutase family protein [Geobacteraceae bacterium]